MNLLELKFYIHLLKKSLGILNIPFCIFHVFYLEGYLEGYLESFIGVKFYNVCDTESLLHIRRLN